MNSPCVHHMVMLARSERARSPLQKDKPEGTSSKEGDIGARQWVVSGHFPDSHEGQEALGRGSSATEGESPECPGGPVWLKSTGSLCWPGRKVHRASAGRGMHATASSVFGANVLKTSSDLTL